MFSGFWLLVLNDCVSYTLLCQVDLLPKGTDLNCIGDWVVEATTKKKLK